MAIKTEVIINTFGEISMEHLENGLKAKFGPVDFLLEGWRGLNGARSTNEVYKSVYIGNSKTSVYDQVAQQTRDFPKDNYMEENRFALCKCLMREACMNGETLKNIPDKETGKVVAESVLKGKGLDNSNFKVKKLTFWDKLLNKVGIKTKNFLFHEAMERVKPFNNILTQRTEEACREYAEKIAREKEEKARQAESQKHIVIDLSAPEVKTILQPIIDDNDIDNDIEFVYDNIPDEELNAQPENKKDEKGAEEAIKSKPVANVRIKAEPVAVPLKAPIDKVAEINNQLSPEQAEINKNLHSVIDIIDAHDQKQEEMGGKKFENYVEKTEVVLQPEVDPDDDIVFMGEEDSMELNIKLQKELREKIAHKFADKMLTKDNKLFSTEEKNKIVTKFLDNKTFLEFTNVNNDSLEEMSKNDKVYAKQFLPYVQEKLKQAQLPKQAQTVEKETVIKEEPTGMSK